MVCFHNQSGSDKKVVISFSIGKRSDSLSVPVMCNCNLCKLDTLGTSLIRVILMSECLFLEGFS